MRVNPTKVFINGKEVCEVGCAEIKFASGISGVPFSSEFEVLNPSLEIEGKFQLTEKGMALLEKMIEELKLTKADLRNAFSLARENNAPFVFIGLRTEAGEKVVSVPKSLFDKSEEFYCKAYDDNLVHCMNSQVYITNVAYGVPDEIKKIYKEV